MLLYFYFWQPVYFRHGESTVFPSESKESRGRFVGIAEHVGHAMTFKVLADDSQRVLYCSAICSAIMPGEQNLQVDPLGGEMLPSIVKLSHDPVTNIPFDPGGQDRDSPPTQENGAKSSQLPAFSPEDTFAGTNHTFFTDTNQKSTLTFHPSDLVGHTFLLDSQEDGQWFRARIVEAIDDYDAKLHNKSDCFKFRCSINNDQYEEILTNNEILNYIGQQDDDGTKVWKF